MDASKQLAGLFEEHRGHLRAVAYRMLGSLSESEDAVQETWLRLARSDVSQVQNLRGWLTTVVGRVCLNALRTRDTRREQSFGLHMPDPVVSQLNGADPEQELLIADAVGLALLVVLDTLSPAERLAFVLHDMFSVPFDEIAAIVERTPATVRQLASRARRRVRQEAPLPDPDLARQRVVVDAFFAASRAGDFAALVSVLDPDIVLRSDGGPTRPIATMVINGSTNVAGQAVTFGRLSPFVRPALINGTAGAVVVPRGDVVSIMAFVVRNGKVVSIDVLADPGRLRRLDLAAWIPVSPPPAPSNIHSHS
ncbi:MAG: RNA polymerase sigma factor SigJ [Nakamurella sp.]